MDPISALALACNVTQLVEQAIGVIVACKKLHKEGSLDENNEIEEYAENIAALNKDIKAVLQNKTTPPTGTKLLEIANAASDTAAELKIELNKLKLSKRQGLHGTGLAFKAALKSLYNRSALDRLQKKLEQQDAVLQSGLLKRLYADFSLNQSDQQANFQKLSQGQKDIVAQVLKTKESVLISIDKSIKASEENVIAHFEQDAARQRLLDALAFPEMNERHHMIEDRVSDFALRYEWLFRERSSGIELDDSDKDSDDAVRPWNKTETQHDFVDWLRTGAGLFWISGKPGSGKSTLMACIYQNLQEGRIGRGHLKAWAGIKTIQFLSFWFFRPASTHLLKSLQGFLRSICFQILDVDISITKQLRENLDGNAPSSLRSFLTSSGVSAQSWTNLELKTWLNYILEHSGFMYCLVVDGLDEVERPESREHVLEAVQWLSKWSNNIKICCSSRPENPFKRVLEQSRFLKLQDFNFDDIKKACHQRLANTRAACFADIIARRAEGVFLWAHMVAEDLRAAADRGDDDTDMQMRLEESPKEMNDLFMLMLERMDKFYMKRPGPYLRLIDFATKARHSISLLELLLASRDREDVISRVPDNLDQKFYSQLDKECLHLETNVVARCGALVEFIWVYRDGFPENFPHKNLVTAHTLEARFIHRSAQDFLADSKHGAALLETCNMSESEAATSLFVASVVNILMRKDSPDTLKPLAYAMSIERKDWLASHTLLMDAFFTKQYREYDPSRRSIISWKLSSREDRIFIQLAKYQLAAYYQDRLQRLSIDQVQDAIAITLCTWKSQDFEGYSDDFTDVLMRYIKPDEEVNLSYSVKMDSHIACTCPLWQHIYISCFEMDRRRFLASSMLARIRELVSFADISHVRCWMVSERYHNFRWNPIPDDTKVAAQDLENLEVWGVCISVNPNSKLRNVDEVLQWSPSGCNYLFDIDYQDNPAFTQHLQARLYAAEDESSGEQPQLDFSMSDPRVTSLNRKLHILSLQEKVAIVWHSGKGPSHDYPWIYLKAGKFRTANRDENRESWEEGVYEKSTCEEDDKYDTETTEMIKCMLNDDKEYVDGIRNRIHRRNVEQFERTLRRGRGRERVKLRGSVDDRIFDMDLYRGPERTGGLTVKRGHY